MHRFASSEVLSLQDNIAQTFWTGTCKECIRMLSRATSFFLKPLKKIAEGGFEVEVKSGKICSCFPVTVSHCCEISEAEDLSAVGHEAGTR